MNCSNDSIGVSLYRLISFSHPHEGAILRKLFSLADTVRSKTNEVEVGHD